jgi:hypothetical protein
MRHLPALILAVGIASSFGCRSDRPDRSSPEMRDNETVTMMVTGMT